MRVLLLCVLLLLVGSPALATIHVVTTDGSAAVPNLPGYLASETAAGTAIATTINVAAAGDTVYVHTGTYDERITNTVWNADNIVVLGAQDGTTFIDFTGTLNYTMAIGDRAAGFTGAEIRWINLKADNGTEYAFQLAGGEDTLIRDCTVTGPFKSAIVVGVGFFGAGQEPTNVTFQDCTFAPTYSSLSPSGATVDIGTGGTMGAANGVTFQDCTFDFSGHLTNTDGIRFRGSQNVLMENCTIDLPFPLTTGASFGISIWSEAPSIMAEGFIFRDLVINVPNVTVPANLVTFSVGRHTSGGQDQIVDDVLLERVTINTPYTQKVAGFKVEGDYNGTPGSDDSHSDDIRLFDVAIYGGQTGLGFHENTRNSIMSRCKIVGPGTTATAGYQTFGTVIEDAKHVRIVDNWISNVEKAITLSHSGDGVPGNGFHNRNVLIAGNFIENATKGINMQYDEGITVVTDSMCVIQGNVYRGVTNIGYLDIAGTDTAYTTISAWQGHSIPINTADPFYMGPWTHASGEVRYEDGDSTAALRATGGIPAGFLRRLGASEKGLIK